MQGIRMVAKKPGKLALRQFKHLRCLAHVRMHHAPSPLCHFCKAEHFTCKAEPQNDFLAGMRGLANLDSAFAKEIDVLAGRPCAEHEFALGKTLHRAEGKQCLPVFPAHAGEYVGLLIKWHVHPLLDCRAVNDIFFNAGNVSWPTYFPRDGQNTTYAASGV